MTVSAEVLTEVVVVVMVGVVVVVLVAVTVALSEERHKTSQNKCGYKDNKQSELFV